MKLGKKSFWVYSRKQVYSSEGKVHADLAVLSYYGRSLLHFHRRFYGLVIAKKWAPKLAIVVIILHAFFFPS